LLINKRQPSGARMSQKIAEIVFPEFQEMLNNAAGLLESVSENGNDDGGDR
jgi:hypothetical protein